MGFSSRNSQSMGTEFHHSRWVVPLWIFPVLQFNTAPLIARDTCNPHIPGTLFVGSQQFSWTWSWSKQSYRRVLHNEVTSSHRPAALPAAAQTTGTKTKWHKSCTSLQNNSDVEVSLLVCVQWHRQRAGKKFKTGMNQAQKTWKLLGCKSIIPSTHYHFVPGSVFRTTHKERVLKSTASSVWAIQSNLSQEMVCAPLASSNSAYNHQNYT